MKKNELVKGVVFLHNYSILVNLQRLNKVSQYNIQTCSSVAAAEVEFALVLL